MQDACLLSGYHSIGSAQLNIHVCHDQKHYYAGICRYASLGSLNGGVLFVRPCMALAKHMQQLATSDPKLQFRDGMGEQDYLDWYFKFTRWILPGEYNSLDVTLWTHNEAGHLVTMGGVKPIIVHHGTAKPFDDKIEQARPTHRLLCRHHTGHN